MTVEQQSHAQLLEAIAGLEPGPAAELLRARGPAGEILPALIDAAEGLVIADLARALDITQRLVAVANALREELPRARARRA